MTTNKKIKQIAAGVAVVLGLAGGGAYVVHASHYRSTDNAYVNGDVAQIGAQLNGLVTHVAVHDSDRVHKGDLLFELDARPFEVALDQAQAKLAEALQGAHQVNSAVDAAQADVVRQRATLVETGLTLARTKRLAAEDYVSKQSEDVAQANFSAQAAAVTGAQADLRKAQAASTSVQDNPEVLAARAAVAQAKLDLEHTRVFALADGVVSNLTLASGTVVTANTPLFVLVADKSFWVDANFKETELEGLHPGQPVEIRLDMYPKHVFLGVVGDMSGGTGQVFSLLPAQNATGNWVKVTQRIPVKVRFKSFEPSLPFSVGATASVSVKLD